MTTEKRVKMGALPKGTEGVIREVGSSSIAPEWIRRLLEMGFLPGAPFKIVHEAPLGGDPIAVRVRGGLVALRRNEANAIEVSVK